MFPGKVCDKDAKKSDGLYPQSYYLHLYGPESKGFWCNRSAISFPNMKKGQYKFAVWGFKNAEDRRHIWKLRAFAANEELSFTLDKHIK